MRMLVLAQVLAATWYVQPGGTGNGTQGSPFGTVQQGVNAADAGDTVSLAAGTYLENVAVTKDGITLTAQVPGTAVVNGQGGAALQKPALFVRGGGWQIIGVAFVDGGVDNLRVSGATCPADGGLLLHGIFTGGTVLPPSRSCTALPDAGDSNSHDVRVDCLKGPVTIEQSTFLAHACTENLYLSNLGSNVLVQDNELSGSHVTEMTIDSLDGGEIRRNYVHGPCCDGFLSNARQTTFGIHVTSSVKTLVHHNLVVGTGQYGIDVFDPNNVLSNESVIFSNNTLIGVECGLRFNAVSGTAHSNLISDLLCTDAGCKNPCNKTCGVDVVNTEGGAADQVNVGFDLINPEVPGTAYCAGGGQNITVANGGAVILQAANFVNGNAGNFRLQANSPAIDKGDPATPPGLDFDSKPVPVAGLPCGTPRADIGCFEFQPPADAGPCDAGSAADAGRDAGAGPVAVIAPSAQSLDAGATANLDGTGSSAPAGATLVTYTWTETGGPTGFKTTGASQQQFVFNIPGTYTFQLVVQDSAGRTSAPATATVSVGGDVLAPGYSPGCGCSALQTPLLVLAAFVMGRRRRASRSRPSTDL